MALVSGTAFITGAASGIGRATALAFARYGITNLALADIDDKSLAASSKELQDRHPHVKVRTLPLDVQRGDDVRAAVGQIISDFGRLDIAVNNAGIVGSDRPTHEVDEAEWRRIVNTNLDGVWRCQREEILVMLAQDDRGPRLGRGRIINMASMYGVVAPYNLQQTAYTAAKHGVVGLTRADANRYGPHNIRLNAICPGYVETPLLLRSVSSGPVAKDIALTPLRRLCAMDEVADAISFLASPMSSFMQGATLVADGGYSSQ